MPNLMFRSQIKKRKLPYIESLHSSEFLYNRLNLYAYITPRQAQDSRVRHKLQYSDVSGSQPKVPTKITLFTPRIC